MWSDKETRDDCLGFSSYITVLSEICIEKDLAPLTLGIFGSWGSGKTSLMQMLKSKIETLSTTDIKTIWFNAWRYEGKEEAQSALIHSILGKLDEEKSLGEDVKEALKKLKDSASVLKLAKFIGKTVFTMTPDITAFIDCFRDESEKIAETMENFEKDFEKLLNQVGVKRIIVFIDDLDRCQSQKVIEIFETIKLFLNVPECTFVIGADSTKIEQAIGDTYSVKEHGRPLFAKDYLEKIIQLPFRIPEQQLHDITCYIGLLILQQYVSKPAWTSLLNNRSTFLAKGTEAINAFSEWVMQHKEDFIDNRVEQPLAQLQHILPYVEILGRGLKGNPRQIKRFLNIFILRQRIAEQNSLGVSDDVLMKLTVLEYAWPEFFVQVVDTFDLTNGTSPLIMELIKAKNEPEKATDSELLKSALETPGLVSFLETGPLLDDKINMAPYLFLAQTALGGQRISPLSSLDEMVKTLSVRILNEDRIRSNAAARQAARSELSVANAIVKALVPLVLTEENEKKLTHLLTGLDTICNQHKTLYRDVVVLLTQFEPKPRSAAALCAVTLINNAAAAGIDISPDLREKLEKASPMGKSLSKLRKQ